MKSPVSIPRPLVRTNQWFIVVCVVLTWLTGAFWLLGLPLIAGLMGIFLNFNPVMRIAKLFLRKHPSEYIPEDRDQQRFNQAIASFCLLMGIIGYSLHLWVLGYIFTVMVALAAFIAILGFCVGCFLLFQWKQFRYRRKSRT